MKKLFLIISLLVFFYCFPAVFGKIYAAYLKFDKDNVTTNPGEEFTIGVVVDSGGEEISSTDVYVSYDSQYLEAKRVEEGTFFPVVQNNIEPGRVYVAGLVDYPASSKTGSGLVAILTFRALKNGSVTLRFDCPPSTIIKSDINATNIIECSRNTSAVVTIGNGGLSNPTPTQLPTTGTLVPSEKFLILGGLFFLSGILGRYLLKF